MGNEVSKKTQPTGTPYVPAGFACDPRNKQTKERDAQVPQWYFPSAPTGGLPAAPPVPTHHPMPRAPSHDPFTRRF